MAISLQQLTIYLYSANRAVIFAIAQLSCYCYYRAIVIVLTAFICTCFLFCIASLLFSYSANSRKCVIKLSVSVSVSVSVRSLGSKETHIQSHNHITRNGAETSPLVACEIQNWFQIGGVFYKSLNGLAPPYLSDNCQLVTDVGRRHLRSSDVYTCVVPRTQSQIGDRSFSVAGPQLWNNLSTEIRRRGTTFGHYRRLLQAFLFV